MANDKVFSARADEETIDRLNELAEKTGMKKAEILPALLNAWEANRVREALPGRTTEIDNFHNLLQQDPFVKASALFSFLYPNLFHFFHGAASGQRYGTNYLEQICKLFHGLAFLVFFQFFVQFLVQQADIILF